MSLPTLQKTWQFSVNNAIASGTNPASARSVILAIKNALIGFASSPWVVQYSCNGTTAGSAGDGVDRWSTTSDIVLASAASAHSWMVLKQTGIASNFQILLSASPEGGGTYQVNSISLSLLVSPSAGFTGGSTTSRPTAADEIIVLQTGTGSTSWMGQSGANTPTFRLHFMQSTDGACTRILICNNATTCGFIVLDAAANSASGWTTPFVALMGKALSVNYNLQNACDIADMTAVSPSSYKKASLVNGAEANVVFTVEGYTSNLGPTNTTYGTVANEVDGGWSLYPIGIASTTVGARGRIGSIIDMWFGSGARATGDSYPATGTLYQFAQFGSIVVPWDSTNAPAVT